LGEAKNLRFREIFGYYKSLSTVFMDNQLIKDIYSNIIAISKLPSGEIETKIYKDMVTIFLQQFFPSKHEFGSRFECCFLKSEKLDDIRSKIFEKTGCQNIAFSRCCRLEKENIIYSLINGSWKYPTINNEHDKNTDNNNMEVDDFHDIQDYYNNYHSGIDDSNSTLDSFFPHDGYIIYFKDSNENDKLLSDSELRSLKHKSENFHRYKEESLTIKQAEINLEELTNGNNIEQKKS